MTAQLEPVWCKVAVKIIKAGMDASEVIARFAAERQALALMEHPNMGAVLDGGATESGRPYAVMELVKGVPITDHSDKHKLAPPERLNLFLQVCHAVQHAHQKGVIHHDLKPSNVLVTERDGEAVLKIIDFGVVNSIGPRLTNQTTFTRLGHQIGTPAFLSHEQPGLDSLDVDTRSDIYALGMLLYELLTGTTALAQETLHQAAEDEVWPMIRETDPPRPSRRLQASAGS